jgi:hypothetical protein
MMAGKLYGAIMVMYNDMQRLIICSFPSKGSLVALLPTYCARMQPLHIRWSSFFGRNNYILHAQLYNNLIRQLFLKVDCAGIYRMLCVNICLSSMLVSLFTEILHMGPSLYNHTTLVVDGTVTTYGCTNTGRPVHEMIRKFECAKNCRHIVSERTREVERSWDACSARDTAP